MANSSACQSSLVTFPSGKRAEEALARLAAIVDSSEDAIIGKTPRHTIISWNHGAERIYGYTGTEAIGQPIGMLLPPGSEDEVPTMMERIRRGEKVEHYETKRQRKDGTIIDVSVTVSPIKTRDGDVIRPVHANSASRSLKILSERERQVLELVAQGYGTQEIAKQMLVSVKTVETYRARIAEKLGLRTRKEIVRFAVQMGLLTSDTLASTPPPKTT
jgi:PAS domain S-box-containing protein